MISSPYLNFNKVISFTDNMGWGNRQGLPAAMVVVLLFFYGSLFPALAADSERPARHIGSLELQQMFDLVHLVDCRSRLEYDVLRMKNAVHVPLATMVREDIERLRAKDSAKAIVFYCNGEDCPESLAAFEKAARWGYENIFVYRPGILNWARERPEKVLFLDDVLGQDSQNQLFGTDHYLAKCLPPDSFVAATRQSGTLVVDIRDREARDSFSISLPNLKYCPVDRLVKLIKSGSRKVMGKKILILDVCGGQAQWLQYVLDDHDIDYAFLKGGVVAWRQAGFDRSGNITRGNDS